MPRHFIKSITFDNSKGFIDWRDITNRHDIYTGWRAPNQREQ